MPKQQFVTFIVGMAAFIALVVGLVGALVGLEQGFISGLTAAMVYVTAFYTYLTSQAVKASNKQAEASAKMVNEMKEERLAATKPVIVQKPVHKTRDEIIETSYFSHFIVCNIGNGTAIEPVIVLRNENKDLLEYQRKSFFKPGEETTFKPAIVLKESKYYIDCVYMDMSHITGVKSLHRTRLPFKINKASKEGELYLIRDELSFDFNISENEVQDVLP